MGSEFILTLTMALEPLIFTWSLAYFGFSGLIAAYSIGFNFLNLAMAPLSAIVIASSADMSKVWNQRKEREWDRISKTSFHISLLYGGILSLSGLVFLWLGDLSKFAHGPAETPILLGFGLAIIPLILCTTSWTILRVYERVYDIALFWSLSSYVLTMPILLKSLLDHQTEGLFISLSIFLPKVLFSLTTIARERNLSYLRWRKDRIPVKSLKITCHLEVENAPQPISCWAVDISDSGAAIVLDSRTRLTMNQNVRGKMFRNGHLVCEFRGEVKNCRTWGLFLFTRKYRYGILFKSVQLDWFAILENSENLHIA